MVNVNWEIDIDGVMAGGATMATWGSPKNGGQQLQERRGGRCPWSHLLVEGIGLWLAAITPTGMNIEVEEVGVTATSHRPQLRSPPLVGDQRPQSRRW